LTGRGIDKKRREARMETVTITKIRCETRGIQFGYYDPDKDEFIAIESATDVTEAAEKLHCSAELLDVLVIFASVIRDKVGADLRAIWKRLDEAEI
jgi:hypothetical protein